VLIHTVLPWHKNDFPRMANEAQVMDALRPFGLAPGDYMMPRPANTTEMKSAEFAAKMSRGPVVQLTVRANGPVHMGATFVRWFLFLLVVGLFSAYIASRGLAPGAAYLRVFQLAGATAFIAHAMALWPTSIWYGRSYGMTIKESFDALIYALLTGGVFGWLWPQ
jgi:hypothetical protein